MPTLHRRQQWRGTVKPEDLRQHWPGCSGPCDQGRSLCPCPSACQTNDDDRNTESLAFYWGEFWSGMSPAARVVFWTAMAILTGAGTLHFLLR